MGDVDAQLPVLSTWLGHTEPRCSTAPGYPAVGPERQGAGSMPAACKISQTVNGATAIPSFASSSWIR